MRRALASIVFSLLAVPAFAVDWLPYTDTDAGFSVEFPGTPEVTHDQGLKAPDGSIIPVTDYTVIFQDNVTFLVSVIDLGNIAAMDAREAIDGSAEGFLQAHTMLSDQEVTIDGQPGRTVVVQDGDSILTDEIVFAHGHLFQVVTGRPQTAGADVQAMVVRFTQSLHFVHGTTS
jgi:hypothetical protein